MFKRFAGFMMGRYGNDHLNFFLIILAFVLSIFSQLLGLFPILIISYAMLFYVIYRSLSRNITARRKEAATFAKFYNPFMGFFKLKKQKFKDRKTYTYFKCPKCKQQLRAPKGRGKIFVTCQKCHNNFEKNV